MLKRIQDRKQKRNKILMSVVLVFLMVFSILGIIIGNSQNESYEYNGFKFQNNNGLLYTKINKETKQFFYLPQTLLEIQRPSNFKEKMSAPMMFLTFSPSQTPTQLAYTDLLRNEFTTEMKDTLIINAMTENSSTYNLPIITCANATEYMPVIYFSVSNSTAIVNENNCIILNANGPEFLKLRDLVLYTYYGVIDG